MKAKLTLLVIVSAIVTLSFTVVTSNKSKKSNQGSSVSSATNEQTGGFTSEDPIK